MSVEIKRLRSLLNDERHLRAQERVALAEARGLLGEVAASGVVFEDGNDYVEVQIDRGTWDVLAAFKETSE